MSLWIDTHCHLDAAEFSADLLAVRARARQAGVGRLVIPGVAVSNFQAVRELAHLGGDAYALGIHPLYVAQSVDADLATLADELTLRLEDPRLVAVGEIGLDVAGRLDAAAVADRLAAASGIAWVTTLRRSGDPIRRSINRAAFGSCGAAIGCTERGHCMQRGARPPPCGQDLLDHRVICNDCKEFRKPADRIRRILASGATNCSDARREFSDPCGVQFWRNLRRETEFVERLQAERRVLCGEDPLDLRANPFARERGDERGVTAHRRRCCWFNRQTEARREARGAQHAQRILSETLAWITYCTK
jgi:hypothetical protein